MSSSPITARHIGEIIKQKFSLLYALVNAAGTTLTLVFNSAVHGDDPISTGLTITADGSAIAISASSISGSRIILTVAQINQAQDVRITYDSDTGTIHAGSDTANKPASIAEFPARNNSTAGGISCTYALNADLALIQAVVPAITERLALSNADQTVTYTIKNSISGVPVRAAATTNVASPQAIDFATNPTAIEWGLDLPALSTSEVGALLQLYSMDLSHNIQISISSYNTAGSPKYAAALFVDGLSRFSNIDLGAALSSVALRMDPVAGTVQLYLNGSGTPETLSSNTVTIGTYLVFAEVDQSVDGTPTDAGKTFAATLRSAAPDYVTPMPTGTKDACGNALAA